MVVMAMAMMMMMMIVRVVAVAVTMTTSMMIRRRGEGSCGTEWMTRKEAHSLNRCENPALRQLRRARVHEGVKQEKVRKKRETATTTNDNDRLKKEDGERKQEKHRV
eukprot:763296-Hanusia_phi.AAC.2